MFASPNPEALPARLREARLLLCLLLAGCPVPPTETCAPTWESAEVELQALWPDADSALGQRTPDGEAVWYWAHKRSSVDGFGVVLATVEHRPVSAHTIAGLPEDVEGGEILTKPSLLFFDQTDGPMSEWELIGMGHHWDYTPCTRPELDCVQPYDIFLHEAGYHRVILGDGGMTPARDADLKDNARADSVDRAGCYDIDDSELVSKPGLLKHGRAWVTHIWFPPEGTPETALLAVTDPWERWRDAPTPVEGSPRLFLEVDDAACGCASDDAWSEGEAVTGCRIGPATSSLRHGSWLWRRS